MYKNGLDFFESTNNDIPAKYLTFYDKNTENDFFIHLQVKNADFIIKKTKFTIIQTIYNINLYINEKSETIELYENKEKAWWLSDMIS